MNDIKPIAEGICAGCGAQYEIYFDRADKDYCFVCYVKRGGKI